MRGLLPVQVSAWVPPSPHRLPHFRPHFHSRCRWIYSCPLRLLRVLHPTVTAVTASSSRRHHWLGAESDHHRPQHSDHLRSPFAAAPPRALAVLAPRHAVEWPPSPLASSRQSESQWIHLLDVRWAVTAVRLLLMMCCLLMATAMLARLAVLRADVAAAKREEGVQS